MLLCMAYMFILITKSVDRNLMFGTYVPHMTLYASHDMSDWFQIHMKVGDFATNANIISVSIL